MAFNTTARDSVFAQRTGLKQGVQSGVYALESKYSEDPQYANNTEFNPITVESSTTGVIERSGLVAGTYSENISTLSNNLRNSVPPALAQISKFSFSGTLNPAGAETFTVTVNGKKVVHNRIW